MALTAASALSARENLIYVLSLGEEIDAMTWRYTRQAIAEAKDKGADLFVVDLNTYGGALQDADSIRTALLRCPIPTVAFIDHNAASAGALIALACDSVFMTEGSSMGAATVVDGTGAALPDKYQSYMRSIMRSTAEAHGKRVAEGDSVSSWRRDPQIAEAMVDHRIIVPGLIDSTKVLTFTPEEAEKWGFADGTAPSLDSVLERFGYDPSKCDIEYFVPTLTDKILGFLSNSAVQALLIAVITAGLFLELKTPGLGFAGGAAVVAAVLYFMPMCITGVVDGWVVILFIAGVVSLALEIFVIPGFGVAGILGSCAIFVSVVTALVQKEALMGVTLDDVAYACLVFCIGVGGAILLIWYLTSKHGPKFLQRTVELTLEQKVKDGYIGVDMSVAALVGHRGMAVTVLRPAGKVKVDDEVYDAVAASGFIDAGTRVKVIKYENAQLYVIPTES